MALLGHQVQHLLLISGQDGSQRGIDQGNINAGRSPSGQLAGVDNTAGGGTLRGKGDTLGAGAAVGAAILNDAALLSSLANPIGEDALTAKIAEELAAAGLKAVRIGGKVVLQSLKDGSILCDDASKVALNDARKAAEKPSLSAHKRALDQVHDEVGKLPKGEPGKFGSPTAGTAKKVTD